MWEFFFAPSGSRQLFNSYFPFCESETLIKTTKTANQMAALSCGWTNRQYSYCHMLLCAQKIIGKTLAKQKKF